MKFTAATTKIYPLLAILLLSGLLVSCSNGSDGSPVDTTPTDGGNNPPGTNPPSSNTPPGAAAGSDQDAATGARVTLDGSASQDADGDALTYRWRQTYGPDVTGGTGLLSAQVDPDFVAPDDVSTLMFELVTNDGTDDSDPDVVQVNILEDLGMAVFVDGDNGSDADGDGTRGAPYQSLRHAIGNTTTNGEDIYVMTRAAGASYDEDMAALEIEHSNSLYGGYDANWVRDVTDNRTPVAGFYVAIRYAAAAVSSPTWISGLEITARRSFDHGTSVMAILVEDGTSTLTIENNTLISSDVGPESCFQQLTADCEAEEPGSSYGVAIKDLARPIIRGNRITAGRGGNGVVGAPGLDGEPGEDGDNGTALPGDGGRNYSVGGQGGSRGLFPGINGGDGGVGGCAHRGTGTTPGAGGIGGSGIGFNGDNGDNGGRATGTAWNGEVGFHDDPPAGGTGTGDATTDRLFNPSSGGERPNTLAVNGCAGGGGGGGEGGGDDGGAGGGGGGGGQGGGGGHGGAGGGASVGIWLYQTVAAAEIMANSIRAGAGGHGNHGGAGGQGGAGGSGGAGRDAFGSSGGRGGRGGNGARGGNGSVGGGGGGGPSYGIYIGPNLAPRISDNYIESAQGGNGGTGGNGGDGGWSYGVYAADAGTGCCVPQLLKNSIVFGLGGGAGVGQNFDDNVDHNGVGGQMGRTNWQ